jgi:hypothetical protein
MDRIEEAARCQTLPQLHIAKINENDAAFQSFRDTPTSSNQESCNYILIRPSKEEQANIMRERFC